MDKFESEILAVMPEKIESILGIRKQFTVQMSAEEIEAAQKRASSFKNIKGEIALLPIHGYISHRASLWALLGYETSSELLGYAFDSAVEDPSIGAIVFDIDSPGGTGLGLSAITNKIYNARGKKPIIAVTNDLMASAAYFIGSAADEVIADPDSETGSIGTIGMHFDYSKALDSAGIKATIIKAGKYKGDGNPYESLSDDAKDDWQNMVNDYYETFVNAVARNRGTTNANVKSSFGQGRVFTAKKAKEAGLIDRIATFEEVINSLVTQSAQKRKNQSVLKSMTRRQPV
jgi:signal peptide peptidase SppA